VNVKTTSKNEMPQEVNVKTETSIVDGSGSSRFGFGLRHTAAGSSKEIEQDSLRAGAGIVDT
jgi:beta-galactosidase